MGRLKSIVLDTSAFTNRSGEDLDERAERLISAIEGFGECRVFMPSSVAKELSHFAGKNVMSRLRKVVEIRDPARLETMIPSSILYDFISEMRERIDKGLRLAERAARSMKGSSEDIRELREKYRKYLREGIVDSKEDADVVILARETGSAIVTSDRGIMKMAGKLGIEIISPEELIEMGSG